MAGLPVGPTARCAWLANAGAYDSAARGLGIGAAVRGLVAERVLVSTRVIAEARSLPVSGAAR